MAVLKTNVNPRDARFKENAAAMGISVRATDMWRAESCCREIAFMD